MAVAFIIRDKDTGTQVIGLTTRLTRLIGRVTITSAPGSFTIPLEDGTPFFLVPTSTTEGGLRVPAINQDGRNLSWPALGSGYANPNQVNFDIIYGYY